jgi:hypothetical protein
MNLIQPLTYDIDQSLTANTNTDIESTLQQSSELNKSTFEKENEGRLCCNRIYLKHWFSFTKVSY